MRDRTLVSASLVAPLATAALLLGCSREVSPWIQQFGREPGAQELTDMAVGPDGEVALFGVYRREVDFGGAPLSSPDVPSASGNIYRNFIALQDDTGGPLWSRQVECDGSLCSDGHTVAIAPNGDVVIAGDLDSKAMLDSGTPSHRMFLSRLDHDGELLWSKEADPGAPLISSAGLALTLAGDPMIGGAFWDKNTSGNLGIVAKFDAHGNLVYSMKFGGSKNQVEAIAVDPTGAALFVASSSETIDLDGGSLSSDAGVFVGKLGADGDPLWLTKLGLHGMVNVHQIAVDSAGDVVLVGDFYGVTFGGESINAMSAHDPFVAKLSAQGQPLWFKSFGSSGLPGAAVLSVAVDRAKHVLFTGGYDDRHNDSIDFGGGKLPPTEGREEAFLAELDAKGAHVKSEKLSTSLMSDDARSNRGTALAIDPAGGVVVGGSFSGKVDFGDETLTSKSNADIFLVRRVH